jgi:cyclase
MNKLPGFTAVAISIGVLLAPMAHAQMGDPAKVTLKTTPVAGNVTMIEGVNGFAGGNVAVSVGEDGLLVVDDKLEPLATKLRAALAGLSKKPVRFVVNTHVHLDHTGGNAALGAAGAVIVAHYNVRKRLSADQFIEMMGQKKTIPASPAVALPVVTFNDDLTFFFNGDEIQVVHVPPAHTDGDALIYFKKANVLHMGDTFLAGYPIVDHNSGGTFEGYITAADKGLAIADDATKIIPGHGPIMTKADLAAYREMLVKLRDEVASMAAKKKSLDEIKAAKLTAAYDATHEGFVKPDMLIETIYKDLPPAPAKGAKKKH